MSDEHAVCRRPPPPPPHHLHLHPGHPRCLLSIGNRLYTEQWAALYNTGAQYYNAVKINAKQIK